MKTVLKTVLSIVFFVMMCQQAIAVEGYTDEIRRTGNEATALFDKIGAIHDSNDYSKLPLAVEYIHGIDKIAADLHDYCEAHEAKFPGLNHTPCYEMVDLHYKTSVWTTLSIAAMLIKTGKEKDRQQAKKMYREVVTVFVGMKKFASYVEQARFALQDMDDKQ